MRRGRSKQINASAHETTYGVSMNSSYIVGLYAGQKELHQSINEGKGK